MDLIGNSLVSTESSRLLKILNTAKVALVDKGVISKSLKHHNPKSLEHL